MRWQLAQNTLVVVSIALAFGKHIGRFKLDAIGIEQFRTLPNHTLVFARRTARKHKRVVRQGTELFDADGVKLEPSDVLTERQRNADDDKRILGELPPHWGVFSERER